MGYIADIGVPILNDNLEKTIDIRNQIIEMLKEENGQETGAGCGFGYCDVQMFFMTFKESIIYFKLKRLLESFNIELAENSKDEKETTKAYFSFYDDEPDPYMEE